MGSPMATGELSDMQVAAIMIFTLLLSVGIAGGIHYLLWRSDHKDD